MWRPGLKVAAVITVVGWLAGLPQGCAQEESISRGPSNFSAVSVSGPELDPTRGRDSPSLRMASLPAAGLARQAAMGSDPLVSNPRTAPRPVLLIGLYVSFGLLQALDAESTLRALQGGKAREGNPLLCPFASNPAALATIKLGLTGGTIFGIDRLCKSHRRLGMAVLAAINAGYTCMVVRNYRSFSSR